MKDIYASIPINKTAALVTNQKGCTSHNGLSDVQKREDLKCRFYRIKELLKTVPKNSADGKRLGREQFQIQEELRRTKKRSVSGYRNIEMYIIDILKKRMTPSQWKALTEEARQLKERTHKNAKDIL